MALFVDATSESGLCKVEIVLEELPLACQKTHIRLRLEDWTDAEIAADTGVSRSMVEKRRRARPSPCPQAQDRGPGTILSFSG